MLVERNGRVTLERDTAHRRRWGLMQWVLFPVAVFFPAVFASEAITPTGTDWSSRSWNFLSILMSWFDGSVPVPSSFGVVFSLPILAAIGITYLRRRSVSNSAGQE